MATLNWIGGGNNQATNPNDWSPTGVPQSYDTLYMNVNTTINITGGTDFAGDTLNLESGDTVNLSHQALASASAIFQFPGSTYNISGQSTLNATVGITEATFNLSQNSTLNLNGGDKVSPIVNVYGSDSMALYDGNECSTTINLAPNSNLRGTINAPDDRYSVTLNGGSGAVFNNNGDSAFSEIGATVQLNADIIGSGRIAVTDYNQFFSGRSGIIEFVRSVGPNQTVWNNALIQIDQPNLFAANATLAPASAGDLPSEIDLLGLAQADSYTYKNDVLNILSGNKIIDTLRLHDSTLNGFVVEPPTAAGSVNIVAITDPLHPPPGLPNLTGVV